MNFALLTAAAEYSNLFVVLMGLGTVFVGLICIIVLCSISGAVIQAVEGKKKSKPQNDVKAPAAAPAAPVAAPAPVAAGNGQKVNAPMPGTILKVNVAAGDAVKAGDVLMILEAMKMENEIMAPADGKVSSVTVAQGQSVDTGATLCTIE